MPVELTSQERMARMLERRDHDRIPRSDVYWPETIKRWQGEGLAGGVEEVNNFLCGDVADLSWSWPVPFPGREEIVAEDDETKVVRNNMGNVLRWWKNKWGTPEHISFGCDSANKWFGEYKPALLRARPSLNLSWTREQVAEAEIARKYRVTRSVESFEAMRQLLGDEAILMAMAAEPDWVRDMSRTYTDLLLKEHQMVLDAGAQPDALWVYGDVGYNHGTFFSPEMYRELVLPDHRRMCDWAHARDLKFIYHSDGDVRTFLDLFVEAGFDCIQPLEAKARMDVRQLAPRYGSRLSFFGNIDMTVALRGDRGELEHEVRSKLAAAMPHHGYAYHSDHSVPPQVSWDTYRFLIDLVDRFGNY